ncbi:MAG: DUF6282 family protein [Homoserinimonas sp.]
MFDSHVHAAPDVIDRIGFDDEICAEYEEAGFSGFVLKAHHESTVGRAAALSRRSTLDIVGGVALNHAVGGINPAAVASALASGGRVVWFPTGDSHTQQQAGLPRLRDLDDRLEVAALSLPPLISADGATAQNARHILDLIAEHDAVLCTGHISRPECLWLIDEARARGISRILLTHPSYTVPGMSPSEIGELADRGVYVEITAFQLWHQPGMDVAQLAEVARAAGPMLVLSSDAGQPNSPPPPQALKVLVEALDDAGCDTAALVEAAGSVPRNLMIA